MKGYSAFVLTENSRKSIAENFKPKYDKFIGHHITDEFGIEMPEIVQAKSIEIVGYACDNNIEAFIVEIDRSATRKDGGMFHLTWSLRNGHKPVESNNLIKSGFRRIEPIKIRAEKSFIFF